MSGHEAVTDRLRRAFAELDEHRQSGLCPDPGTIWDGVHGRLDPPLARDVAIHLAACAACAADWRIAMRSEQRGACLHPATSVNSQPAGRAARWTALAAAATLLLAALVFTVSQVGDPTVTVPVYREAGDSLIRSLLPDGSAVPRRHALLRWTPVGEDALYSIEVGTLTLAPLASAHDLKITEFVIPGEALRSVGDGESIVWQVEASLPDGRRVASEAFVVRIE